MKRCALGVFLAAGVAGLAVAGAAGFSRGLALPESGALTILNTQKNAVWRPCGLTLGCPRVAERTLRVLRVVGNLEYPIAEQTATAQTFVYEFEAHYWSGQSNGVKVTVTPACTGLVEVICE
jgi:hypothetical protein